MDFLEESDSEPGPEICDVLNNCSIIVDGAHADMDGGLVIGRDNKARYVGNKLFLTTTADRQ